MAKQTFTTGQVLTAAQMTSLQQTAMLGGAASAKTASYTLVAADAGSAISMSNASATTITVNTALFAAGDTVQITNLGAGVCTITAGTATVNTSASLALAQYESGTLDFTSTSAAIFIKGAGAATSPSFVGCLAYANNLAVSITGGVATAINMASEEFDTDGFHSTSSNTSRITIPTGKGGKYLLTAQWDVQGASSGDYFLTYIAKNGTALTAVNRGGCGNIGSNNFEGRTFGTIASLVATDYVEFKYQQGSTNTPDFWLRFGATFLGV